MAVEYCGVFRAANGRRTAGANYLEAKRRAGGAKRFTVEYDALGRIKQVTPHGGSRAGTSAGAVRSSQSSTPAEKLAALRQDGAQLHRQYRGNIWAVVDDPALRIWRCELEHESVIRARFASSGHPGATAERIWGYALWDARGCEILISRSCPREERVLTVLHEVGHARAYDLYDDGSEAAATAWKRGWLAAGG